MSFASLVIKQRGETLITSQIIMLSLTSVLNNISSLPEYFLTSMWLSAAHDVVVRPDFKSPESAQLYVEQCELENFSVKLGDLYPSSLFESHRESITVVHLPVFSSHPKDGC